MTIEDEEEWVGEEMHIVPALDPDDKCNGKKKKKEDGEVVRNEDDHVVFGGYCRNPAGKGTDHTGEGRCEFHGGQAGAPAHNQNAAKTHMTSDPHHYHENLPQDEKQWIEDTTAAILDRVRKNHRREPDFLDRALARSIAIEFHILSKARDYTKDELIQVIFHDGNSHEEKGALVEEIRRYSNGIINKLKQLGVLEDPESQKADALGEWRQFVAQGQQQTIELPEDEDSSEDTA